MSDYRSISEARAKLPDLVKEVSEEYGRVTITVNGKPKAILLSAEELESLEETAEILAIPGARESIKQGMDDIKKGRVVPFEEVLRKAK